MKKRFVFVTNILFAIIILSGCKGQNIESRSESNIKMEDLAPTPPMGWNSYDSYDWRINEEEFKANVDFMSEHLKPHGYEYAVIDFLWYIVDSAGAKAIGDRAKKTRALLYDPMGNIISDVAIDKYGRYLPDPIRFPSAKNGKGFGPIADYVHSKGLKFGIHIMRGVPRPAAKQALPIKGSDSSADYIAEPWDTCSWENSMFGINFEADGAQEYYNSLIELYASWGVDFIKADDIMFPEWHPKEIEMLHKAIEKVGRPIVLSLSLGEPQFYQADFLIKNANMWRISGDFWDNWTSLSRQFDLCKFWANYRKPGTWPDADMLPVGHLALNGPKGEPRMSQFTWPEHYTLMTLWSIAQSPLMIGGALPSSPDSTFFFLTNDEVLYVNQYSERGHQIYKGWADNTIIWLGEDTKSDDTFFALFNIGEQEAEINFDFELDHLRGSYQIRDLWHHTDLGEFSKSFSATLPSHGAGLYRMSNVE